MNEAGVIDLKHETLRSWEIQIHNISDTPGLCQCILELAKVRELTGWIEITNHGILILFNANVADASAFRASLIHDLPSYHHLGECRLKQIKRRRFTDFTIKDSTC